MANNSFELYETRSAISDTESIEDPDIVPPLPMLWRMDMRCISDSFHIVEFFLDPYDAQEMTYSLFVRDISLMIRFVSHTYPSPNRVSAMRLPAQAIDVDGDIDELSIRFEKDLLYSESFIEELLDYMNAHIAPIWVRTDGSFSDSVSGKYIHYPMQKVQFLVERVSLSHHHVTKVVGEQRIHSNIYVKKIDSASHGVAYSSLDCIFVCLNEETGMNLDPIEIRKQIWPEKDYVNREICRSRHISKICDIYSVSIILYDVESRVTMHYGAVQDENRVVKLVKVGKTIGIYERHGDAVNFEKDLSSSSISEDVCYACYDLETVQSEEDNKQRVYAYCIKMDSFKEIVCDDNVDLVERSLCKTLVDMLHRTLPKQKIYCYAWNGSRFDARILLSLFVQKDIKCKAIIINSANELLTFTIYGDKCGAIIFRDPCKLFPEKLSKAAEIFGLPIAKADIDHDEVEKHYNEANMWVEYISENKRKIMSYVERDVDILEILVHKIKQLYLSSIQDIKIPIHVCISRSMASYVTWKHMIDEDMRVCVSTISKGPYDEVCTVFTKIKWVDIYDDAIAGRVQATRTHCTNAAMIDIKSQYPYVAAFRSYPVGETTPTSSFIPDKLGVYRVQIRHQNHPYIIPYRKNKTDPYNWSYVGPPFQKWVTSIDVDELLKNGADFDIIDGFYWESSTENYFKKFMTTLFELRSKQPKNSPMSLHYKIEMNALTGAIFQKCLREYIMLCSKDEFDTVLKKYSNVITVVNIWEFKQDRLMCMFRPIKLKDKQLIEMQKELCSQAIVTRPSILTMFIYAYARQKLLNGWRTVEQDKKCKVIYCDTDSLVFTNSEYGKKILYENNMIGSNLGDWEIEKEDAECYIINPKTYAIKGNQEEYHNAKIRIKGVANFAYCSFEKEIEFESEHFKTMGDAYRALKRSNKCVGPSFNHVKGLYENKFLYIHYWHFQKNFDSVKKVYQVKTL
jgi:hypothetical protein